MSKQFSSANRSAPLVQDSSVDPLGSAGERSEPERTNGSTTAERDTTPVQSQSDAPDPEVVGRAVRRRFTEEYKRRILAELDAARGSGNVGHIIRREGLYTSQVAGWRKARADAELSALAPRKRGPKPVARNPLLAENITLKRDLVRLQKKLRTAELVIDLQKKVSQILGIALPELAANGNDDEESS